MKEGARSARAATPVGLPLIGVRRAGCDEGGRQFIDRVRVNTYFGSVDFLDIGRCEYINWRAFGVNSPAIEHYHPIAVVGG